MILVRDGRSVILPSWLPRKNVAFAQHINEEGIFALINHDYVKVSLGIY